MRKIELLESEMDGSPTTEYVRYDGLTTGSMRPTFDIRTFIPNPQQCSQ